MIQTRAGINAWNRCFAGMACRVISMLSECLTRDADHRLSHCQRNRRSSHFHFCASLVVLHRHPSPFHELWVWYTVWSCLGSKHSKLGLLSAHTLVPVIEPFKSTVIFSSHLRFFLLATLLMRLADLSLLHTVTMHTRFSLVLFNDGTNSWAVRHLFLKDDTPKYLSFWEDRYLGFNCVSCPDWIQLQYVSGVDFKEMSNFLAIS